MEMKQVHTKIFTNHDFLLHITIRYIIIINKWVTIISDREIDRNVLGKSWHEKIREIVQCTIHNPNGYLRVNWRIILYICWCKLCLEWKISSSIYFIHSHSYEKRWNFKKKITIFFNLLKSPFLLSIIKIFD